MRLTAAEHTTIRETVRSLAGTQTRVRLFGSRTDDSAKGGRHRPSGRDRSPYRLPATPRCAHWRAIAASSGRAAYRRRADCAECRRGDDPSRGPRDGNRAVKGRADLRERLLFLADVVTREASYLSQPLRPMAACSPRRSGWPRLPVCQAPLISPSASTRLFRVSDVFRTRWPVRCYRACWRHCSSLWARCSTT